MRSVIKTPNPSGIKRVVRQQFDTARIIMDEGFVPIIEPEVDIHCKTKSETEVILLEFLCAELNNLHNDDRIIF